MPNPVRRPRVALVGPTPNDIGGISAHMEQLLGSYLADAVELLYFEAGNNGMPESRLHALWRIAMSPLSFFAFLITQRVNLVHINTTMVPKAFARDAAYVLVARLLGRRVIYQVHGGALPERFVSERPLLNRLLRWVLNLNEAIVLLARVELDAYRRYVPRARLELIPNAIDIGPCAREPVIRKLRDAFHLAYVGRLIREKGIFEAVEAIALLVMAGRSVVLSIAGSGPQEEELRARVAALGLENSVRFVGRLFDQQKHALWRSAHIFVFPTFFLEGLPYALLEAMAAGAVPLTTRAGAIPDVMEDSVHGIFVPARDSRALAVAVALLDDDREALARMANAGRQRVFERYTVTRLADDFESLYSRVLDDTLRAGAPQRH